MQISLQNLIKRIQDIKVNNKMVLTETKSRIDTRIGDIYKKINAGQDFMKMLHKEISSTNIQTPVINKTGSQTQSKTIESPDKPNDKSLSQEMMQQFIQSGLKDQFGSSAPLVQGLLQKHLQNQNLLNQETKGGKK